MCGHEQKVTEMKKVTLLLSALLLISGSSIVLHAQEKLPQRRNMPYVLEINYFEGRPLAYLALNNSVWFAAFPRIADWKPQAGYLPVSAVKLYSRIDGVGVVRVKVTVLRGPHHEFEDLVADHVVGKDKTVIAELANFGVVPFELTLVNAPVTTVSLPEVKNDTRSVLVNLEPMASDLPKFRTTFSNISSNPVAGLSYRVMTNGRSRVSAMPRGEHGDAFINAGSSLALPISFPLQPNMLSTGDVPQSDSGAQLIISAVLFKDGSYEGNVSEAARLRAFGFGEKVQTARILDLLRSGSVLGPRELAFKADQLSYKVTASDIVPLLAEFPGLSQSDIESIRFCAEASASSTQKDFKGVFGTANPIPRRDFSVAVDTAIKTYETWLNALP